MPPNPQDSFQEAIHDSYGWLIPAITFHHARILALTTIHVQNIATHDRVLTWLFVYDELPLFVVHVEFDCGRGGGIDVEGELEFSPTARKVNV